MPETREVRVLRPDPQSGGMAVISVCVPETIPLFRVGQDSNTDLGAEVRAYAVGSVRPLGPFASVGNSTLQPDEFLLLQRDSGPPLVAGDPPLPGAGRRRVGGKPARWYSTAWEQIRTWCATTPPVVHWALPAAATVLLICALGAWAGAALTPMQPAAPAVRTTPGREQGDSRSSDKFGDASGAGTRGETNGSNQPGVSGAREPREGLPNRDTRDLLERDDADPSSTGIEAGPGSAGAPAQQDSARPSRQDAGVPGGAPDENTAGTGSGLERAAASSMSAHPSRQDAGVPGEFRPDREHGSPHNATPVEEPDPRRSRSPRFPPPMANPAWEAYVSERAGDPERAEAGYLRTWNRALTAGKGYGALKVWALQGLVRTGRRLEHDYSARMAEQQLTALRQAPRYSGRRKEK